MSTQERGRYQATVAGDPFTIVVVTDAMVDAAIRQAQACGMISPWPGLADRLKIRLIIGAAIAAKERS